MANIVSTKKRARQAIIRTQRNKHLMNRMRTYINKLTAMIESGNKVLAKDFLPIVESIIAKTANRGVIAKNAASRKISKLSAAVKALR